MKIAEHGPNLASLQEIVDSVPALIHTARPDGFIDFFNQRWLEFVGRRLEDLEGWNWTGSVHPDDVDALVARWRACIANGEPLEIESRVRRADGVYRWMWHQKLPLRNAGGEIVKWYGSSVDIDDRKRAEYEVRKHEAVHVTLEAQLQATLNIIPAYTWYAAPSGALTFVNERSADYFGLPSDHPLRLGIDTGASWDSHLQLLHPDDHEDSRRVWSTCLRTGSAGGGSFRARSASGAYRWFLSRVEPLRAHDGTLLYWIGMNLDIEEHKQAEFYLAEGQRLAHTGSWAFNAAGFDYWSPELFAIYGLDPHHAPPNTEEYLALVHPDDRAFVAQEIQTVLAEPRGFDFTKRIVRPDGAVRHVRCVGVPTTGGGTVQRFVGTGIDVTEHEELTRALRKNEEELQQENVALREEIDKASMFEEIVGASAALKGVLARVSRVAASDSTVLINGETGTGKELVARAIHRRSGRSSRAFVAVNCAAIPRDLIASELFGHEKGAFTGATQRRLGRFELADGGTIFLDEVGEISPDTQVALLRVLQEREFERVGGRQPIQVDVRVIAATNRDLQAAVASGTFRQDLFYRLNVFPLEVPPLRDRREDIPVLVEYFVDRYARKAGKTIRRVNKRTLDHLQSYRWPGNVRELQNVIERSVIVCDTDEFTVDESWLSTAPAVESPQVLSSALAGHEKAIVEDALRASGGRVFGPSGAAARLGIARSTLESKIRALGINKNRFRGRQAKT